ncbi:MAG: OmpA family protein [Thermodesulfobacteriota bacterium]|nr:OmpA family protein [Thermodesulfobacteriota bacterium]
MIKFVRPFFLAVSMAFCIVNLSFAGDCEDGREMLEQTLAKSPDEMTEEYFRMALEQCPDNSDFCLRIAEYYKNWYAADINHENQARFKDLAEHYYRKALAVKKGKGSKAIQSELARLESSREFNVAAFRALRPASQGSTGSGLNIKVNFMHNSFELTGDMQDHLDQLGKILVEDKSLRISLEGHTDMSGPEDYNRELSIKRSQSVKEYLVSKFDILPDRILTTGYGYERLADNNNPYSARNRRVEVIKLSE